MAWTIPFILKLNVNHKVFILRILTINLVMPNQVLQQETKVLTQVMWWLNNFMQQNSR